MHFARPLKQLLYIITALAVLIAALRIPSARSTIQSSYKPVAQALQRFSTISNCSGEAGISNLSLPVMNTPVYFFSHGGPSIIEDVDHPAYKMMQELGHEITTKVKPKGVVVFSAHWEGEPNKIQVNTAEITPLIYDFYGFPDHYYKFAYPNVGSKNLAQKVMENLEKAGIEAEGVTRGLDHGVWAHFTCAFNPQDNPLNVPIVQVSLFDSDDGDKHYRLGKAISALRHEGIQIIVSGMAVHNLRERFSGSMVKPYTVTFDKALKEAVETPSDERQRAMAALLMRSDARRAHPSFEHLLPIFVGAGAAGTDAGKQLFTLHEGSMSWAQFRFGEVVA